MHNYSCIICTCTCTHKCIHVASLLNLHCVSSSSHMHSLWHCAWRSPCIARASSTCSHRDPKFPNYSVLCMARCMPDSSEQLSKSWTRGGVTASSLKAAAARTHTAAADTTQLTCSRTNTFTPLATLPLAHLFGTHLTTRTHTRTHALSFTRLVDAHSIVNPLAYFVDLTHTDGPSRRSHSGTS
jgi:hypothetical protein